MKTDMELLRQLNNARWNIAPAPDPRRLMALLLTDFPIEWLGFCFPIDLTRPAPQISGWSSATASSSTFFSPLQNPWLQQQARWDELNLQIQQTKTNLQVARALLDE
jgi:hypothetical protein